MESQLKLVLDTYEKDEKRHWEESDRPDVHIYRTLKELRQLRQLQEKLSVKAEAYQTKRTVGVSCRF